MKRLITAAILVVLIAIPHRPANALAVSFLDATVALDYGSLGELAGDLQITPNPYYPCCGAGANPASIYGSTLTLNGQPLYTALDVNTGFPGIQDYLAPVGNPTPLFNLEIYAYDLSDLNLSDFVGAKGGTVTINSETLATPLPQALPMFSALLIGCVCFAAWKRRRGAYGTR